MALIDIELAAWHLKGSVDVPEFVEEVNPKMEQATALVIQYIKRPDHTWTSQTDPGTDPEFAIVQAAILKVLANLYAFRGDDQAIRNPLQDVEWMLTMFRKPTLS